MTDFYVALGMVAPFYNLALVIVAVWLFITLFRTPKSASFMKPWYLLFACVCLFILEEALTIARSAGFLTFIPQHTNAFWELGIITIFIYVVLLEKEYVNKYVL